MQKKFPRLTDPGKGAVWVCAVVRVQVAERFVSFVVNVVEQVVTFARQFAGVGARSVLHRRYDADRKLSGGAAHRYHAEHHRRRHLRPATRPSNSCNIGELFTIQSGGGIPQPALSKKVSHYQMIKKSY